MGWRLIALAPVIWFALAVAGMALQASFFTLTDYLEKPMWTEHMNRVLYVLDLPLVFLLAVGMWLLVPASVVIGLCILARPQIGARVRRYAVIAQAIPIVGFLAHFLVLSLGYISARATIPSSFPSTSLTIVISTALPGAALVLLWRELASPASPEALGPRGTAV